MMPRQPMRILTATIYAGSLLPALLLSARQDNDRPKEETPPPAATQQAEVNDAAAETKAPPKASGEETAREQTEPKGFAEVVRFGDDAAVQDGEEVGEFVVIFGSGVINGHVHGNAVVIGGNARVNGQIDGNLVVPLGSAELGAKAHVKENLVVVGGSLTADPGAKVDGDRNVVSWEVIEQKFPPIVGAKHWVTKGLILGRPLPHQRGWWWWAALSCALVYLLVALMFRQPIAASVGMLESRPVGSFFVGVLIFILFVPLLLLLVATGVGLIVVPFVFCAAIVAFLFGKIAVYRLIGEQVGRQTGASFLEHPVVALVAGIAIIYVVYMIPVVGFLIWGITAPLGFGAAILAALRAFRREGGRPGNPASVPATAVPAAADLQPPVIGAASAGAAADDLTLLPRAGFWIRFLATILDLVLVGVVTLALHFPPFTLLAWVAYHIGMWTWRGTTIGGVVFGIKIIRTNGRPVDFAVAVVRCLAGFFSALVLFLGFFWAGWNREKRSWHDIIAGTIVVRMPKGVSLL